MQNRIRSYFKLFFSDEKENEVEDSKRNIDIQPMRKGLNIITAKVRHRALAQTDSVCTGAVAAFNELHCGRVPIDP